MLQKFQKAPSGINSLGYGNLYPAPGLKPGVFFCHHHWKFAKDFAQSRHI